MAVKAVTTGTVTWGKESFSRTGNSVDFYFVLGLFGLVATAFVAAFVYEYRFGEAPHWPIGAILFGGIVARALVKSLQSGEALDPAFTPRDEPRPVLGVGRNFVRGAAVAGLASAGQCWALEHRRPRLAIDRAGRDAGDDLGILLRDLIVGWGFSVWDLRGRDIVRNGNGIVTGDAVARAVLQGEGDDPQSRPRGFRAIGRLLHYRYGAHAIAAADYVPGAYVPV